MLASSATVATQAFQAWLTRPTGGLGWRHGESSVAGTTLAPLDTWCDMTYLLPYERWLPEEGVRGLAYFCGVLADRAGEGPAAAHVRVGDGVRRFLESSARELWPGARQAGGFDWSVLADGGAPNGAGRLLSQHWRANVAPSERYVLTPAGTVADRLAPGDSGLANLVLAGDWTRNGIDGGCVEAAVRSGRQAAQALVGRRPGRSAERGVAVAAAAPRRD
jgi:hypothetical protein